MKRHYSFLMATLAITVLIACQGCSRQRIAYIKYAAPIIAESSQVCAYGHDTPLATDIVLRDKCILLEAELNGKPDTVMLDMGVNAPMARMVTRDNAPDIEFFEVPLRTSEHSVANMSIEPAQYKLGISRGESYCNVVLVDDEVACTSERSVTDYTLFGTPAINKAHVFALDFSNGKLRMQNMEDTLDLTGYTEAKCKFSKLGIIYVYLTIDGKERKCLFDTGNSLGVLLKDKGRIRHPHEGDIPVEGSYARTASGNSSQQRYVVNLNETVTLGETSVNTPVYFVEDLSMDNIGIDFIAHYDWVFETIHDKVYYKPRISDLKPLQMHPYALTTTGGQLTILNRRTDMNPQFEVGDVIKSVDGVKITADNICDYFDMLIKTDDWSAFKIETASE